MLYFIHAWGIRPSIIHSSIQESSLSHGVCSAARCPQLAKAVPMEPLARTDSWRFGTPCCIAELCWLVRFHALVILHRNSHFTAFETPLWLGRIEHPCVVLLAGVLDWSFVRFEVWTGYEVWACFLRIWRWFMAPVSEFRCSVLILASEEL